MDCLFCDIANKKRDAFIVYEDEWIIGILDIFARSKGHTLVIPKQHVHTIEDCPPELIGPLFGGVKKVTHMLKTRLECDGFTIGINHGKVSGQEIEHLHIHIMPRYEGDKGGSLQSIMPHYRGSSVEDIYKHITHI